MENENQKPLTLDQLAKYNQEVLLPAFDNRINKLLDIRINDLKETLVSKDEFNKFKDETLTNQDKTLKKLDILLEDKKVREYQDKKLKQVLAIMIKSLRDHQILSSQQLEQIARLEIF